MNVIPLINKLPPKSVTPWALTLELMDKAEILEIIFVEGKNGNYYRITLEVAGQKITLPADLHCFDPDGLRYWKKIIIELRMTKNDNGYRIWSPWIKKLEQVKESPMNLINE